MALTNSRLSDVSNGDNQTLMADQGSPRCTIRQRLANAAIDTIIAADAAKGASDAAISQEDGNIEAADSALQAARTAQIQAEIAEIALRDHIAEHGCKS